ncbi:MAG TPA: S-methyl-5-thioribose-1-phosphate isomerase [Pirellulales bacterium]|nr:S-methyl-5-thioribose-1-phosphate isomerase [Pirellulales bacterium]
MIDQTRLPGECVEIECRDVEAVFEAIRSLRVRGAPAIGIAAAYGVCLGLQSGSRTRESPDSHPDDPNSHDFRGAPRCGENELYRRIEEVTARLAESRPTAVNLFWALDRMRRTAAGLRGKLPPAEIAERLLGEARAIHEEDRAMCHAIGRHGQALLTDGSGVLTHCNAGGLATAEYGTALAVFYAAQDAGKRLHVYADETRPLLQGARLTAWELKQRGIEVTLICDSMAAQVMREGRVQAVVVGADRIAANGDTANKIGTYGVALLAAAHEIPFYVAAPTSTFDLSITGGDEIPIEQRAASEITHGFGRQTAPDGIGVYNPAFDVTPARLIKAIICEKGLIEPVNRETIAATMRART